MSDFGVVVHDDFGVDWHHWMGFAVLKRRTYRGIVASNEREWWGRKKPRKRGRVVRQARKRGESWAFQAKYV